MLPVKLNCIIYDAYAMISQDLLEIWSNFAENLVLRPQTRWKVEFLVMPVITEIKEECFAL